MSEKKKSRRRKDEYVSPGEKQEDEKISKQEYDVAKWLRNNVKTKKTKFLSHTVEYFTASKAIDALLKSKFAVGYDPAIPTREHAVALLDTMLEHKFFHRAKKVPVSVEELRCGKSTKQKAAAPKDDKEPVAEKPKDEKSEKGSGVEKVTDAENSHVEGGPATEEVQAKEKRKRKIRLDMHPEQIFVDGPEAYVWIYDPIPIHYWLYGLILLLGAIVVCLFPLWPQVLRKGVYYLSIGAAGFLVFILALTMLRLMIFTLIWGVTGGKWHLWIFPNLTEDVGFFASFWPLYESKYITEANNVNKPEKKTKKKKKEKDSDGEDTVGDIPPLEPEKIEQIKENDAEMLLRRRNVGDCSAGDNSGAESSDGQQENSDSKGSSRTPSDESDGSEVSGKDYEIINPSDVQNDN